MFININRNIEITRSGDLMSQKQKLKRKDGMK
jgi:hypothetical protein